MNTSEFHPLLAEICNYKMNFICNLIHILLESQMEKRCNPKQWQKEVDRCLTQMNSECNWDGLNQPPISYSVKGVSTDTKLKSSVSFNALTDHSMHPPNDLRQ